MSSRENYKNQKSEKKPHKITCAIVLVVVVGLLVLGGIFSHQLEVFTSDFLANIRYSGSPEIAKIADSLKLTDHGRFVFGATNPVVEDRDSFNVHCDSYDEETSMLGCYGGNRIYVYNVTADELAGIKESTAAHELMHAVWERLGSGEKDELSKVMIDEYNRGDAHERLKKELEKYSEDEIVDELHSRFATEVKNLPEKLEEHYAKYFKDQDAVVVFYENYREPFEKLDAEFQKLSDELNEIKQEYDEKESAYVTRSEKFSREVDEFNNCADTLGCFSSQAAFNSRRAELLNEQAALENMYNDLAIVVDKYNAKVDEYNNSILRGEKLDSKMNSNKVEEI